MPYDLDDLYDRQSAVMYSSEEGKRLRESPSVAENAAFVVRWAAEVYSEWAAWHLHVLPNSKASYKSNTSRIVAEIE